MLKEEPLELLRRANPASVHSASEFVNAIDLHERVLSAIGRQDRAAIATPTRSRTVRTLDHAPKQRLLRRRRLAMAIAVLVAALVSVPLVGARILDLFWTSGTPVQSSDLGAQDQWLLEHLAGSGPTIDEIASDGALSFYVIRKQNGEMCVASGRPDGRPIIGSMGCMAANDIRNVLPTPEHPLYAETTVALDPSTGTVTIRSIVGLADTGVVRVQLLAADGALIASAPVNDHVFEVLGVSVAPPVSLRAIGDDGNQLYDKQIG